MLWLQNNKNKGVDSDQGSTQFSTVLLTDEVKYSGLTSDEKDLSVKISLGNDYHFYRQK